jgi:hypothetical protein
MCEEGYVTERIQDLYDAHGIRPNTFSLIRLIDNFLKQGAVHEARRLVVVVEQMFTTEERDRTVHYPNTWMPTARKTNSLGMSLDHREGNNDDDGESKNDWSDYEDSSERDRANREGTNDNDSNDNNDSINTEIPLNPEIPRNPNYLGIHTKDIQMGVLPTEWGVLSRKNIKERFERYGHTLDIDMDVDL